MNTKVIKRATSLDEPTSVCLSLFFVETIYATPSHGRHTGFVGGKAGMRYPLPWFLLSDDPRRCIRRTTGDYRRCRSSRAECRFSAVEVAGLLASFAFFVGLVMYLCQGFVCTSHILRQDWRLHAGYGLLGLLYS